ncbi:MAG: 23S rRNA (guanosine(2251)-2'-O)-methyltransferase RlmB [Planctomycetaceae bacterium]
MSSLELRNPHSVLAALQTRPQDVLEIQINLSSASAAWKEVADAAASQGVTVRQPRPQVNKPRKGGPRDGRTSLNTASVRPRDGEELKNVLRSDAPRGLWLALDCIQDPHNVGAIFRSAAFFGVQGIVLTEDRSAPLSAVTYDVSAGGVEAVPFSLQTNLTRALSVAKESGMWVLGSSEHAEMDVAEVDRDRRWLLVIGNEEKGMRRLTTENCDMLCTIPCQGEVTSLNASVAAAVLMSHLVRP